MIYVSGGRVIDGDLESIKYSGIYSYDIRANKWKMLRYVLHRARSAVSFHGSSGCLTHLHTRAYRRVMVRYANTIYDAKSHSRIGHSMVLDPKSQTLFIFGGQRDDQYLCDMYALHIPTCTVTELFSNFTVSGGPDACSSQRAVIDPNLREIYM